MPMFDGPQAGLAATLKVEPDQVLRLKTRLEAVRDNLSDFVTTKGKELRLWRAFADDDVSRASAEDFNENAALAIRAIRKFIDELNRTIDSLESAAKTYNLTDEVHATAMREI